MATTNLKILSKILVALIGIWTLTTSCFEIIGITIHFPFTISPGIEIPYHRLQSLRISIFLTFTYFAMKYIFWESSRLAPVIFLDIYLKALVTSGALIFFSNDVELSEYRVLIFFLIASVIIHISSRTNIKKYFS
jgi:hypothetical protein|tara:strand:+ start:253 stop:657 length:405 start_codon:yes stop_codon:yes gene_type:complete